MAIGLFNGLSGREVWIFGGASFTMVFLFYEIVKLLDGNAKVAEDARRTQ